MNHDPDIGERLKRARRAAGYTQEGAAALLGVHYSTLLRWERSGGLSATALRDAVQLYHTTADAVLGKEATHV